MTMTASGAAGRGCPRGSKIGRGSWRGRGEISVGAGLFKKKKYKGEAQRPYSNNRIRDLMTRYYTRFGHYYLYVISMYTFQSSRLQFKTLEHAFILAWAKLD